MSGHLTGIVTARLNDLNTVRSTGAIPQNVNFALKTAVVRTFLESKAIGYQTAESVQQLSSADVGEIGQPFTVKIECYGPQAEANATPPQQQTARDASIDDIVGRWCGRQLIYTFSRTDMMVTFLGKPRPPGYPPRWFINKMKAYRNWITVFWKAPGFSTTYELSGDKRTLVRVPQTEVDMGPHVFHRC
jgi:hypothetical protein